jgi:hypothetical protein
MENQKDLFKKSLDKAFTSLPELNSDIMMDGLKYKDMVKEEGDEDEYCDDCDKPKSECTCKKKKGEHREATGSGSVGSYSAPVFGGDDEFWKRSKSETPTLEEQKIEAVEATGSGSVGAYETPSMWAKSTNKKDWGPKRKPQYKGGKFVSVKKKCTKFPYCNQGDINALHIYENENLKNAIKNVSKKFNLSETTIKAILEYEYEKLNK